MKELRIKEGKQRTVIIIASISFPFFVLVLLYVAGWTKMIEGKTVAAITQRIADIFLGATLGNIIVFLFGGDDKAVNQSPKR